MNSIIKKLGGIVLALILCLFVIVCHAGIDLGGTDEFASISSGYDIIASDNTWTCSFWANFDDISNSPVIIQGATDGASSGWYFQITGAGSINWVCGGASFRVYNTGITTGGWHHLVFVKTGAGNNGSFFLDNTQPGIAAGSIASTPAGSFDLVIGKYQAGGLALDGKISEFALWDVDLNGIEVSKLLNAKGKRMPLQVRPASLQIYLPLDGVADGISADGVTFLDMSGNGNDAVGDEGAGAGGIDGLAEEVLTYP